MLVLSLFVLNNLINDGINELEQIRDYEKPIFISTTKNNQQEKFREIDAIVYAYSSCPFETSGDPFITASGQRVRKGIVANNCLPFGTVVMINDTKFEVYDRMNSRYSCNVFDIWMETKQEAINFGKQKIKIKIYE